MSRELKSVKKVEKAVRFLADSFPDNRYQKPKTSESEGGGDCSYIHGDCTNGSLGCIVGQALVKAGFHQSDLQKIEGNNALAALEMIVVDDIQTQEELAKAQKIAEWLCLVQEHQDCGRTWGLAVQMADKEIKYSDIAMVENYIASHT